MFSHWARSVKLLSVTRAGISGELFASPAVIYGGVFHSTLSALSYSGLCPQDKRWYDLDLFIWIPGPMLPLARMDTG